MYIKKIWDVQQEQKETIFCKYSPFFTSIIEQVKRVSNYGFQLRFPITISNYNFQLQFPITISNYNFQLQFPIQIWFGLVWFGITTHSDQTLFLTQFYFRWVLQHIQACPELGPVAVPACFLTKLLLMKQLLHHVKIKFKIKIIIKINIPIKTGLGIKTAWQFLFSK